MNNSVVYSYKGSEISFMSGDNVMVNATQMAKPFGKSPKDFLKTEQTKTYVETLSEVRKILSSDLVKVIYGDNGGTWMHEDVALEFARWLSPAFAIWCNDRIKELLKTGVATVSNDDEAIAYAMQVLNKRLEESRAEKERLEAENQLQSEQLKLSAPKVQYVDNVLQSSQTYTSTQMAKELGFRSGEDFHKKLKAMKVMYYQSRVWMLTAKYCGRGYTKSRTTSFTRSDDSTGTNTITVWTEKGRNFLHSLFNAKVA